jgi:amidohydrolase
VSAEPDRDPGGPLERWATELARELPAAVRLRHELHARPELSGREQGTAERVVAAVTASRTAPAGESVLVSPVAGTGRLLRIGPATGPAVAVRAELDALPITEQTGAPWSSVVPGSMHACGHDLHLAAAAALARSALTVHGAVGLPAALVLILQPREELSPSGARDVVDSGLLVEHRVRSVVGVHVQPRVAAGRVTADPGVVNAGVDEFTITIRGHGGHSAYPHLTRDPVPALCQSVLAVRDAAAAIDPMRPAVVTVGTLQAGSAPNVIGDVARARGTMRTVDPADRERLHERLQAAVAGTAAAFGCAGELTVEPGEAPLHNDPGLVAAVRARLARGSVPVAEEFRSCGSDDFAAYGEVVPSLMMFLGVVDGSPMLHDARFLPPDRLVGEAAAALLAGYLGGVDLLAAGRTAPR